jgi:hypothetical protein
MGTKKKQRTVLIFKNWQLLKQKELDYIKTKQKQREMNWFYFNIWQY